MKVDYNFQMSNPNPTGDNKKENSKKQKLGIFGNSTSASVTTASTHSFLSTGPSAFPLINISQPQNSAQTANIPALKQPQPAQSSESISLKPPLNESKQKQAKVNIGKQKQDRSSKQEQISSRKVMEDTSKKEAQPSQPIKIEQKKPKDNDALGKKQEIPKPEPRKKKIAIKQAAHIKQEIEQKKRQIQELSSKSNMTHEQQSRLETEVRKLTKQIKNSQNKVKYIRDNKADSPQTQQQVKELKDTIEKNKIESARLNDKIRQFSENKDGLQNREFQWNHQILQLEEQLEQMQKFERLSKEVKDITELAENTIQQFDAKNQKFPEQYQKSQSEDKKEFQFNKLKKIAEQIQKQLEKKKYLETGVKNSQFSEHILLKEVKFQSDIAFFATAKDYVQFCKYTAQKKSKGQHIDKSEHQKTIYLNLLKNTMDIEEYRHLQSMISTIKVEQEYKRIQKKKKEDEEKKERQEQEKKRKEEEEKERKRKEEEETRLKKQKIENQNKFSQALEKVKQQSQSISKSIEIIKFLQNIKEQYGSQQIRKNLTKLREQIKKIKVQQDKFSKILSGTVQLAKKISKEHQLLSYQTIQKDSNQLINQFSKIEKQIEEKIDQVYKRQCQQKQRIQNEKKERRKQELLQIEPLTMSFYLQDIVALRNKQGSQIHRYLLLQQKYLNQLKIAIELSSISQQELKYNNFNFAKYLQLLSQKTKHFQSCQLPSKITQDTFKKQQYQQMMAQIQKIEVQLHPMETIFNLDYIKLLLYKFPPQTLIKSKQELFDISLKKEIEQLQTNLQTIKLETQELQKIVANIREENKKLLKEAKQTENMKIQQSEKIDREIKKQFVIDQGVKNKILDENAYQPEYKITVGNENELVKKYEDLNNDKKLQQVQRQLQDLVKQKEKEKQLYEQEVEDHRQMTEKNKSKIIREVYIGDYRKVKSDSKVQQLENQLNSLKDQWRILMEKKRRGSSGINKGSQIRLVSLIQEF